MVSFPGMVMGEGELEKDRSKERNGILINIYSDNLCAMFWMLNGCNINAMVNVRWDPFRMV